MSATEAAQLRAQIRSATDALNSVWSEAASKMYSQTAQQEPPPGADAGPAAEEPPKTEPNGKKVEDADYEVVDEGK